MNDDDKNSMIMMLHANLIIYYIIIDIIAMDADFSTVNFNPNSQDNRKINNDVKILMIISSFLNKRSDIAENGLTTGLIQYHIKCLQKRLMTVGIEPDPLIAGVRAYRVTLSIDFGTLVVSVNNLITRPTKILRMPMIMLVIMMIIVNT